MRVRTLGPSMLVSKRMPLSFMQLVLSYPTDWSSVNRKSELCRRDEAGLKRSSACQYDYPSKIG